MYVHMLVWGTNCGPFLSVKGLAGTPDYARVHVCMLRWDRHSRHHWLEISVVLCLGFSFDVNV